MNFYEYYKGKGAYSAYLAFEDKKSEIQAWLLSKNISKNNIANLQQKLNDFIYPSKENESNNFTSAFMRAYENVFGKKLNRNFSLDQLQYTLAEDPNILNSLMQAAQNKHGEYRNINQISVRRIERISQNAQDLLTSLRGNSTDRQMLEKITSLEDDIKSCQEELKKNVLYSEQYSQDMIRITRDAHSSLNFLLDLESMLKTDVLNSTEVGDIFEYALQAFGNDLIISQQVEEDKLVELIEDIMLKGTQGAQRIKMNGLGLSLKQIKMAKGSQKVLSQYKDIDQEFDIANLHLIKRTRFTNKSQGKTDLVLTLPDVDGQGSQTFNVSAKNWLNALSSKVNLGEVSVFRGLSKSGGENILQSYIYTLGDEYPNEEDTQRRQAVAHEVARLCCIVDIAMGYSQKNSWADTLVINDRLALEGQKIKVFSLSSLIEDSISNIEEAMKRVSLKGYYDAQIQHTALSIRMLVKAQESANGKLFSSQKTYTSLMYSYLNTLKTTLAFHLNGLNEI